jgi:hypothetical protein
MTKWHLTLAKSQQLRNFLQRGRALCETLVVGKRIAYSKPGIILLHENATANMLSASKRS